MQVSELLLLHLRLNKLVLKSLCVIYVLLHSAISLLYYVNNLILVGLLSFDPTHILIVLDHLLF